MLNPDRKEILWLLIGRLDNHEVAYVIPALAWMARQRGVLFETYLEAERNGRLFAKTGSTILGGHHHQQFNYLCARFEVRILRLGSSQVFESSINAFQLAIEAEGGDACELYEELLTKYSDLKPEAIVYGPDHPITLADGSGIEIQPYLFPEILHRRAVALPRASGERAAFCDFLKDLPVFGAFLDDVASLPASLETIDSFRGNDDWFSITQRIAERWKSRSKGVVFGDPAAILSQLATHCGEQRIALYAPVKKGDQSSIVASGYVESVSPAAGAAADLAVELGNYVIHGRQTGDGDIFEWSKRGVCIQIVDPNRPAFPIVEKAAHPWAAGSVTEEVSDEQLEAWADEGKVLSTLVIHSGEVAHNEAMLALAEMAGWSGLKLGVGVHAQRYETAPQLWELIAVAREHGGAGGLVEPLLHSGGLGVLAECNCPPDRLAEHCHTAMSRIERIAGRAHLPKGYYAFMDSNFDRLDTVRGDLFSKISSAGLDYIVSSALPGRNRILWRSGDNIAINQTPRVVYGSSPFVRSATSDDLGNTGGAGGPGWIIAVLDAPVVAFSSYIWKKGNKIMDMIEEMRRPGRINELPSTVARYARLLAKRNLLPQPLCKGSEIQTGL